MSTKTGLDITPDKSLIQKLGLTGYKTEQALAELIDNSIDARIEGRIEKIEIKLDFEKKIITISDNGAGMNIKQLQDGLTIAKGTKQDEKLGKFGLGMKSACSTLGKSLTIITSKIDSKIEYVVKYDEDKWLSDKSLNWTNFQVEQREKNQQWNGTIIVLDKLKVSLYPNQVSKFKRSFGIRYGPYLKNNQIELKINTLICKYREIQLQQGTKQNLDIKLSNGNHLTGWIGLLEKRSIKGDYGIHLFKNGRLIRAYDKFGIRQHPEVAKIIGELSLNHVPVNFHKTGFIEDSPEYIEATYAFRNHPTVREVLRSSGSQKFDISQIESISKYLLGQKSDPGIINTRISTINSRALLQAAKPIRLKENTKEIELTFTDEENSFYTLEKSTSGIKVKINRESDVFKTVKNPLFLIGLIEIEAKLISQNPDIYQEFIKERNLIWNKFIKDWMQREEKSTRNRQEKIVPLPHYSLSYDLIDIHDYLKDKFEHKFQFTALSTLGSFLQNAPAKIIYTVHAIRETGEQLCDLIQDYDKDQNFVVLFEPNPIQLETTINVSPKRKFIVVREYTEKPTSTWAIPEKALVDLYVEINTYKIPFSKDEFDEIFENLVDNELIDKNKLQSIARHKNMLDELSPYMEGFL